MQCILLDTVCTRSSTAHSYTSGDGTVLFAVGVPGNVMQKRQSHAGALHLSRGISPRHPFHDLQPQSGADHRLPA